MIQRSDWLDYRGWMRVDWTLTCASLRRPLFSPVHYFINEIYDFFPCNIASPKHLLSWEHTWVALRVGRNPGSASWICVCFPGPRAHLSWDPAGNGYCQVRQLCPINWMLTCRFKTRNATSSRDVIRQLLLAGLDWEEKNGSRGIGSYLYWPLGTTRRC